MGCIPWADEYMIRRLIPQTETAPPHQWCRSQKGDDARVALPTAYITFPPVGSPWVADVDIDDRTSLPDLEKPVLWWRHREGETKPPQG